MQFNVAQLLKETVGAKRDHQIDEKFEPEEEGVLTISGPVHLVRTRRGIYVRTHLTGTARGTCSRCLKPIVYPIELEIDEEYLQRVDVTTGMPIQVDVPEEEGQFSIDERHTLDLSEAVRQYGTLALSMKPLCRPDCPGLCPQCGRELGLEHVGCGQEAIDSRLSILEQLKAAGDQPA
ncbi:MAG: DUF177 domain-containing protein [Chloroflexota bacterium]|nr:MAG: DUF177 domain-containing protein [Chloroflexota bacterium]